MPAMDAKGLRNHSQHILLTVVRDMRTAQTEKQQIAKSEEHGPQSEHDTPAQTHAMTRLVAGFSLDQMVSEYRALRSSVLRLWLSDLPRGEDHQLHDMIRFNEAIDQALVELITSYGQTVEMTRRTVLGVLGQDLRSPIGAVQMAGDLICRLDGLPERANTLASQICISAQRATQMVNDLLDLARSNLGTGIPVNLQTIHLNPVCQSVVSELPTAHPKAEIVLGDGGSISGQFDPSRIAQVFSNLIGNAVCHGGSDLPINVTLSRSKQWSIFEVQNYGEIISAEAIPHLFNPQGRYSSYAAGESDPAAGLGLGLFIASEIVKGHGGRINVTSDAIQGTVFSVLLPN